MNAAGANQIPLQSIVEHFGGTYSHTDGNGHLWYKSPFRPGEKTASFKVDPKTNKWYDGARTSKKDQTGSPIDLHIDHNNKDRKDSEAIKEALEFYARFSNAPSAKKEPAARQETQHSDRFRLIKQPGKIWHDSLTEETTRRGWTMKTIAPYVKQGYVEDTKTGKKYNGFAFANIKGGWDISIPNPAKDTRFKTSIGPKAISTIAADSHSSICVYEGWPDLMTWLELSGGTSQRDHLSMNSTSMVGEAAAYIIGRKDTIKTVVSFMNNDAAGVKAMHDLAELLEPHNIAYGTMNHYYQDFNDLNDRWRENREGLLKDFGKTNAAKVYPDSAWNHVHNKLRI